MLMNSKTNTNNTVDIDDLIDSLVHALHDYVPSQAQYIILLFIVPLAILCNLFVLYHLLMDSNLRKEAHNHVIIAILFSSLEFNLIHAPFSINLFRTGSVWPRSIIACSIWRFTAYLGCNANDVLLAWAAIERHILIYHSNMMRVLRNRIIFHYIPLGMLVIYLFGFNAACFLTPACFANYNFNVVFCDATCLNSVPFMASWYLAVNQLVAALLAIVFSLILWVRVIGQQKRMKRSHEWRRFYKLSMQVIVITILFIVLETPYAITCTLAYTGHFSNSMVFDYSNSISLFLCYIMPIIMPFACFLGLYNELWPRLVKPFNRILRHEEANRIKPILAVNTMINGTSVK
ncbi:unnamed protein product [Adineta ricciae]|uniref:G-protein coupled receptors family 1 profile domain-containing protein n=1 Tax=Adineta ricciae TaxID=249248 RepID=A0A815AN43_ADIRI|nr:unnamed protein product [Adineta ricciae]CAF1346647.1 unnamed protein product [Adineta ricciae]